MYSGRMPQLGLIIWEILKVGEKEKDSFSTISWGSDADDAAETVAANPAATKMLRAESEDSRAVNELLEEVNHLRSLLNDEVNLDCWKVWAHQNERSTRD